MRYRAIYPSQADAMGGAPSKVSSLRLLMSGRHQKDAVIFPLRLGEVIPDQPWFCRAGQLPKARMHMQMSGPRPGINAINAMAPL